MLDTMLETMIRFKLYVLEKKTHKRKHITPQCQKALLKLQTICIFIAISPVTKLIALVDEECNEVNPTSKTIPKLDILEE